MALEAEGVVDGSMHAEKTLGGASRLEPLHFALAPSHSLMRIFRPIVSAQPLLMRAGQSQAPDDEVPADLDVVRYWDLAATEKTELNDPDWTVGIKLGRDSSGGYYLLDLVRARANPGDV